MLGEINIVLSTQDSVSCDKGNMGCNGGYLARTWESRLVLEKYFAYSSGTGSVEACIIVYKDGWEWENIRYQHINHTEELSNLHKWTSETGFTVYKNFMSL